MEGCQWKRRKRQDVVTEVLMEVAGRQRERELLVKTYLVEEVMKLA